jgi:Ca-activated chloride channel family protein
MKKIIITILFLLLLCFDKTLRAETPQQTNVLFLVDASFSMRKDWAGGTRWKSTTRLLIDLSDSLSKIPNVNFGIRLFGHLYDESESNCKDTKLELAIGKHEKNKVFEKLMSIRPKGITPIALSLEKAAKDFGEQRKDDKNILILITDGEESCNGNPCEIALLLQQKGIVLKPFIVGLALQENVVNYFNCFGKVINTNNHDELNIAMVNIIDEAIAKTTLQVNLLDQNKKPTETGVGMTFYDAASGISKFHFIHTLNAYSNPDTILLSPIFQYNIQVHTQPELWIKNVSLLRNKHSIVAIDASQGSLEFKLQNSVSKSIMLDRVKCLVYQKDSVQFFNIQKLFSQQKYLVGKYDLEILTLPRIYLKNIAIDPNKITHVEIPAPGLLTINKAYEYIGAIFYKNNNELTKLIDLKPELKQETIALQPGTYVLVYRSKFAKSGHNTITKTIEVESGGSLLVKL